VTVRSLPALPIVVWLAACTGGPPTAHDDSGVDVGADAEAPPEPGAPDAAVLAIDASPGDGGQACTPRDLDPVWLEGYEREIVAKLAGTMPIAPGVTLADLTPAPTARACASTCSPS
jgi:hypothetical protein